MKEFGIIKGCIICGVLIITANFFTAGTSFGQGLTNNMKQKGFDRFIYPEQYNKDGFLQDYNKGSFGPLWLNNTGVNPNNALNGKQKVSSYFTTFPKRIFEIYTGNFYNKGGNFKLNRMLVRNDWEFKLNRMKILNDMNFKIINVGPK